MSSQIPQSDKLSSPIPQSQAKNNDIISGSPSANSGLFRLPSPIPTKRSRTYSQSERVAKNPDMKGKVKTFCRSKGHGFITPADGGDPLFVHISDIEGEYVPHEDDDVTYKICHLPFNEKKLQAVHVRITHLAPGVKHEMWIPSSPSGSPPS